MTIQAKRPQPRSAARTRPAPDLRLFATGALAIGLAVLGVAALAQDGDDPVITSHGYSFFGNLDYPADYTHFDFVNPDAPKGGELVIGATGTFDSLNPYSTKGRAGALTSVMYDQLIESTEDSVGQYYCILCTSIEYPESRDWVIFHMREDATFWDGTPVTAEDVVYSHTLFITQGLPSYAQAVDRMVDSAEALDTYTVKFTFNPAESKRSRIETVGSTPVFSKAWFEADPENRRLDEPRLEVAMGSGPYRLDEYEVNRRIVYKRDPDYWGKDVPFNVGRYNYDAMRIEYFADQTASFEAFKAGTYTFKVESDPKQWATAYDFPKARDGIVKLEELPDGSPPNPTGFVFNLAKPQFEDKRVREAIALAFNFEWSNESLLYGLYAPRSSFVEGTHVEAKDVPQGAELAFLKGLGDVVPAEIFDEPVAVMHESDAARLPDRRNLRAASRLLSDAGWEVGDDGMRRNAAGQTLKVNMLIPTNIEPSIEAMHESFVRNLQQVGVDASFERVDPSQYTLRRRERDYDILYSTRYGAFLSTGGGLSQMYGSREAEFSLFNPAGLASPLVDAIIEASFVAESQAETDVALMALDRALRHEFFVIPTGYIADHWVAYYDMYEHPETIPPYSLGYLSFWWINPDKAAALKAEGQLD
ncbi:extracellular solute-binding protein [Mameliella sediminis]|uniref:extracellular solute-binding protein n=1 Tax=Mameliella sediminis TaxID=2836866 RepID=UPI001C49721A|nr:extracellular solute-binding protein [Mameliella sediminis]MBY6117063.1 extracellular solute-binding protein [Antarctobacter heliothermus]MBY6146815.1 extracellular solute-binding protein [Mameliella alba]MBV7396303.1 extracellular solute-binding protein [Mameliella sediminis]MBY6160713.1 extracellular solute-binding protein [Mameliella alba]MBY6169183.1 extracellular solute-binding protein [Mameliella alba]